MLRGDELLLQQVAQGDTVAFAELYDRFSPRVFGLALKLTSDRQEAQDVLQEVFLEIWKRAPLFDESLGSAAAWILMIARGRSIDHLRRRVRERNRIAAHGNAHRPDPPAEVDQEWLARAVPGLAPELRVIVHLAYAQGLTREQIAAALNVPVGTVKTRLRSAVSQLAENMGRKGGVRP